MNTLVPLEYYSLVFYNLMLLITVLVLVNSKQPLFSNSNLSAKNITGILLLVFTVFYIGLRPVSGKYFIDMRTYAYTFELYANGQSARIEKDVLFEYFMKFCSSIMSMDMFFLLCAVLYIYPIYLASKKIFKRYWFYCFFMILATFTFWSAGVNGIRNGIAASLTLLALANMDKKILMGALLFVGVSFHKSMLLPICAYIITIFYNDSKKFLYFWILAIPISLVAGSSFEALFTTLGLEDDRLSYLNDSDALDAAAKATSFRWDFLLYSASAVYAGWFFIYKKNFEDKVYRHLFNVYLIANGFWILVIRANFSNRFAYLSWFFMGIIIIYPLLKVQLYKNQHVILARIITVYFLFAYILGVILKN